MTARSPWSSSRINVCFGEDLPPLLRHHTHPRSYGLTRPWRPVTNNSVINKPCGGVSASPAVLPSGVWRPIPRQSTWTQWLEYNEPEWLNADFRWQTQLHPHRQAVFAVIDSAADARALYEAFPDQANPYVELARMLETQLPVSMAQPIDWGRILDRHIAGVWLTERGQRETHLLTDSGTPSLNGWDTATVWFARAAYRIGKTWPTPPPPPEPSVRELWDAAERQHRAAIKKKDADCMRAGGHRYGPGEFDGDEVCDRCGLMREAVDFYTRPDV